jgi:CheY-like chemotaxis protein
MTNLLKINIENVKKVFVLEDAQDRVDFFTEIFGNISYFITAKVDVAIKALNETQFDLIFLDHDLEELELIEDSPKVINYDKRTGLNVARVLRDTINCETPCIIHSLNPVGASNMLKAHPFNSFAIPYHLLREAFTRDDKK